MVDKKGGFRRKTRNKLKKSSSSKGKISITNHLQEFNVNDKVCLRMDSSYHKGVYHPMFHGLIGIVKEKKGNSYRVIINHKGIEKNLFVHPVHLKKI